MKSVIVYFSWSNNTKGLVASINKNFDLGVYRIERKIPYSEDYNQCAYVEAKEEVQRNIHPEINKIDADFNDFDRILLFFPIWWYTFPMPIATFIESIKGYKGEVVFFANSYTNDPQYVINSLKDLKNIDPQIKYNTGLFNKKVDDHVNYIKNLLNSKEA